MEARAQAVEAIYPLSPAQKGMLLGSLQGARPGTNVEQIFCELHGELDGGAFERACQTLVDRHTVLRTAFAVSGAAEPQQVVGRRARLPVQRLDWRGLPAGEQRRRLEDLLREDKREGFALNRAPLVRLRLVRLADSVHELVWTHHHILLDGWCLPLLFEELSALYDAFRQGREADLPPVRPYQEYIRWLMRRDPAEAERHWRSALRDVSPLLLAQPRGKGPDSEWQDEPARLSAEATARIDGFVRRHRLTLTTLVQGAWALLLSRATGQERVVFGSTVSGRSADVPGIERMIGIFIGTVPVPVRVDPAAPVGGWLAGLQALHIESQQHAQLLSSRVHELSGVPLGVPLYDSLVVVLNYPVREAIRGRLGDLRIEGMESPVRSRFPLTVVVEPGPELLVQLTWQEGAFDRDTVRRLSDRLLELLDGLVEDAGRPLGQVAPLGQEEILLPQGPEPVVLRAALDSARPTSGVMAICADVLGVSDLAPDADLFAHGGNSLTVMAIQARLRAALGVDLPLEIFFRARTPEALAWEVEERATPAPEEPPARVPRDGDLPLSYAQERLWFLSQLEPGSWSYNIPIALDLDGPVDVPTLERTIGEIVRRHETLRTTLASRGGHGVQVIHPAKPWPLHAVEVPDRGEAERLLGELARSPFNLQEGPLLRTALYRLAPDRHILALVLHHAITDGWSTTVLLRELTAVYNAFAAGRPSPLPELPLQYADYAVWQRRRLEGPRMRSELAWWRAALAGLPALPLGAGERRLGEAARGGVVRVPFEAGVGPEVERLAAARGATPFAVLLAAFHLLLALRTGQDDVAVGTDVANRPRPELEPLVGFFVNTILVRGSLAGGPRFAELVDRTRAAALAAFDHQEVPFHRIVEEVRPPRDGSRAPLVQILFVLQNLDVPEVSLGGARASLLPVELGVANFDLCLFLHGSGRCLTSTWVYDAGLYDEPAVRELAADFALLLGLAVRHPHARPAELENLLREERRRTMNSEETDAASLSLLKNVRRRSVPLTGAASVELEPLGPGSDLPLVGRPAAPGADLRLWVAENRDLVEEKLARHGGILFRGFGVGSSSAFQDIAQAACSELFTEYGDLAREEVSDKVYGSTVYPPDQKIHFHNESSHMHGWPRKILFCCLTAPETGGETPIVDCRRVAAELRPALREGFAAKGLRYVRNFTPGLDVGWREFFGTGEREAVEAYCRRAGIQWEWLDGGEALRTWRVCPAFRRHPVTGDELFFNQLQVHHVACLPPEVRKALLDVFREEQLPRNVYYGDGSSIPDEVVAEILEVYDRLAVQFRWQEGEMIVLDNMRVAHARNPFTGARKIVVALGDMVYDDDPAVAVA
jgi:non-ribosomal peptide synthetase component F/alpha-ketoglutarate-dependent taurine dioxygenase